MRRFNDWDRDPINNSLLIRLETNLIMQGSFKYVQFMSSCDCTTSLPIRSARLRTIALLSFQNSLGNFGKLF